MITGVINTDQEATIALMLEGPHGDQLSIIPIIDTGFDRFLTLPPALIVALDCPFISWAYITLADGSIEEIAVHAVIVEWDGQKRCVEVYVIDATPLVGMRMINGYELIIQAVDGGLVTLRNMAAGHTP